MAARPILDIQINTEEFDAFAKSFGGWQDAMKETPDQWAAFAEAMGEAAAAGVGLEGMADAIREVGREMNVVADATELAIAGQARLGIATEKTHGGMHKLAQTAQIISNQFVSAAKWLTIGGGLAGLATGVGLFGLDALARQVTSGRRAAGGLGLDMADVSAFKTNYGPLVDAEGVLGSVAGARNDINSQWVFRSLGIGGDEESRLNNADLSTRVINQVRGLIKGVPEEMLSSFAQARGIDQLLGLEDLRRLRREPADEFDIAQRGFEADRRAFRVPEPEQLAWRDFYRKLNEAGHLIDTALIHNLAGLAGPLTHVSQSIAGLIDAFLGAPAMKEAIENVAQALDSTQLRDGLRDFAKALSDRDLTADLHKFIEDVKPFFRDLIPDLGAALMNLRELIHFLAQPMPDFEIFGLHPFRLDKPEDKGPGLADSPAAHAWEWLKKQFGVPTSDARTESGLTFPGAGDDRIAAIRDKLARDLQIDPAVAGGFLSAPFAESGLRGILQHDAQGREIPGGDAGWGQWHGPRREAFMAWAKEHGLDWRSDAANLGFLEEELRGTKSATLLRLRNARTAQEGADAGDKYEAGERHGPGDYYYREHTANADRFARLPSPHGGAAGARPASPMTRALEPLPPPPPPVPAVPRRTSDDGVLGSWGSRAMMDGITAAIRAGFANVQLGQVGVNIYNETAARTAVSARGAAVG